MTHSANHNKAGKVVILEDDPAQLLLLEKLVDELGYHYKTGDSLKKGKCLVRNFRPDLVVLDLHLTDGSGLHLLETFTKDPLYKDTLFLVVSADDSDDSIEWALGLGAVDFLSKPVKKREFQIRLQNWMSLKLAKDRALKEREVFGRFVSRDVAREVLAGSLSGDIKGENKDATILFFDLRNSTGIAERLASDVFAKFLTDFFTDISDIIFGHMGSVNKFLGDGLLCTFGIPRSIPDPALKALQAARAIRQHISNYNAHALPKYLEQPIGYGIGISSGSVFAGNFGSIHKVEYAVLGDPVNLASRLESLTKIAKTDILLDGPTRDRAEKDFSFQRYKFEKIRGKLQEVRVYGLTGESKREDDHRVQMFF